MKAYVATGMIGSFAFDEGGKLIHYVLFPRDPVEIADRVSKARSGEIVPEEETLIRDLIKSGYTQMAWDKKVDFPGISCMYEPDNPAKAGLQLKFRELALQLGFAQSNAELNKLLSDVNVILTKNELRKVRKDVILMRAVGAIDELDKSMNTLSELMREWYGLYFPEAERLIHDHEQLAKTISKEGRREDVSDKKIHKYAGITAGMPFSDEDLKAIMDYAKSIQGLYKLRDGLTSYIKDATKETIPNLSAIAGPLIACRLLSIAGGLERLAKLPASTMQLLGAEKALFRHLKSRDRPPKFGVLFAHPLIQNAQPQDKGRMARILASKLVMAARADFYTGKDISEKLLADVKTKSSVARPKKKPRPAREDSPAPRPKFKRKNDFRGGPGERGDAPGFRPRKPKPSREDREGKRDGRKKKWEPSGRGGDRDRGRGRGTWSKRKEPPARPGGRGRDQRHGTQRDAGRKKGKRDDFRRSPRRTSHRR